jgi:hypothetical protein
VVFKDDVSTRYRRLREDLTQIDLKTRKQYTVLYTIKNGAIEETSIYPGFILMDRVTTNGTDSCTYSRVFKKKLGLRNFETVRSSNRQPFILSDIHIEKVSCEIAEIPDH